MILVDQNYTITIDRGDDQPLLVTILDYLGAPFNATGATFLFTVKASPDDAQTDAKFSRASPVGNGIDIASASAGQVTVNFIPTNTVNLGGWYYYDLQMTEQTGKIRTLRSGRFFVRKDISTSGSAPVPTVPYEALTLVSIPIGTPVDNDLLLREFDIARTKNMELRYAHISGKNGPNGGNAIIFIQDDPTTPVQLIGLSINSSGGAPFSADFDRAPAAPTLGVFILTEASGDKLNVKISTVNALANSVLHLGFIPV